jgi:hypothetical protein
MPSKNHTALSVNHDAREAMNQLAIKLSAILGTRVTHSQAIQIMNAMIDPRKTPYLQVFNASEKAIRDGGM